MKNTPSQNIIIFLRRISLSSLSGLLAGVASSLFLFCLDWATITRDQIPELIWFLPLAGVVIGVMYHRWARDAGRGHNLIIDEIQDPQKIIPARMGVILVLLFYIEKSYRFVGLGIPVIQESMSSAASFFDPVLKTAFTALTVGSGFKGGEFVPLVFIGTTLGSALSLILLASIAILSRVGFAAVFAGASNTPIACGIMAVEIFGTGIAAYAVAACFSSYFVSGHTGLYKSKRVGSKYGK